MIKDGKEILILYLTEWQEKMVKDIFKVECHTLEIPIERHPIVRYGIRTPTNNALKKMYLTDWQKNEMMDEAGAVCNFIELDPSILPLFRYGMPEE